MDYGNSGLEHLDISVGLSFTNPTFFCNDFTNIFVQLQVKDEYALETSIETLHVPSWKTMDKDFPLSFTEAAEVLNRISQASTTYGGEVRLHSKDTCYCSSSTPIKSVRLPFSKGQSL